MVIDNRKDVKPLNISDYYKSIEQIVSYEQYLSDFEDEIIPTYHPDKESEITGFFEILTNESEFHVIFPEETTASGFSVIFHFQITHDEDETTPPVILYIGFDYD